jgi:hypothetical protein
MPKALNSVPLWERGLLHFLLRIDDSMLLYASKVLRLNAVMTAEGVEASWRVLLVLRQTTSKVN